MTAMTHQPLAPEALKAKLHGVLAFPITPYAADGSLDLAAVRANASWLAGSGVAALVAPSGTGELFGLTPVECAAIIQTTVEAAAGRIPVIAGVGFGPRVASELAAHAEAAGADGVLVLPPYYARPDEQGLLAYYQTVAEATSLALMPYARDSALFSPSLLTALAKAVPRLVAFKDGRGDVRLFQRLRETVNAELGPDRLVWLAGVGDDLVAPYFAAGATGFTSSLACFWPEIAVQLYELASRGNFAELRRLHERAVRPFYELRQRRPGFEVAVTKGAMDLLGHPAGPPRPPLGRLSTADLADLQAIIEGLGIPSKSERQEQG